MHFILVYLPPLVIFLHVIKGMYRKGHLVVELPSMIFTYNCMHTEQNIFFQWGPGDFKLVIVLVLVASDYYFITVSKHITSIATFFHSLF